MTMRMVSFQSGDERLEAYLARSCPVVGSYPEKDFTAARRATWRRSWSATT